jgi:hypothetical protein
VDATAGDRDRGEGVVEPEGERRRHAHGDVEEELREPKKQVLAGGVGERAEEDDLVKLLLGEREAVREDRTKQHDRRAGLVRLLDRRVVSVEEVVVLVGDGEEIIQGNRGFRPFGEAPFHVATKASAGVNVLFFPLPELLDDGHRTVVVAAPGDLQVDEGARRLPKLVAIEVDKQRKSGRSKLPGARRFEGAPQELALATEDEGEVGHIGQAGRQLGEELGFFSDHARDYREGLSVRLGKNTAPSPRGLRRIFPRMRRDGRLLRIKRRRRRRASRPLRVRAQTAGARRARSCRMRSWRSPRRLPLRGRTRSRSSIETRNSPKVRANQGGRRRPRDGASERQAAPHAPVAATGVCARFS